MWSKEAIDKADYIISDLKLEVKPEEFLEKFTAGELAIPDAYEELLLENFLVTKKIGENEVVMGTVSAFSKEDARTKLNGDTAYLLG